MPQGAMQADSPPQYGNSVITEAVFHNNVPYSVKSPPCLSRPHSPFNIDIVYE